LQRNANARTKPKKQSSSARGSFDSSVLLGRNQQQQIKAAKEDRFDKFSVFISIALRRRRRRRSSFECVHFVGSRVGTTFAFSFLFGRLLGLVEEEEELWSFQPQACCSGEDSIGHGDECGVCVACNRVRSRRSSVSTCGTEGLHT
jgi:hypothetical protein